MPLRPLRHEWRFLPAIFLLRPSPHTPLRPFDQPHQCPRQLCQILLMCSRFCSAVGIFHDPLLEERERWRAAPNFRPPPFLRSITTSHVNVIVQLLVGVFRRRLRFNDLVELVTNWRFLLIGWFLIICRLCSYRTLAAERP